MLTLKKIHVDEAVSVHLSVCVSLRELHLRELNLSKVGQVVCICKTAWCGMVVVFLFFFLRFFSFQSRVTLKRLM